MPPKLFQHCQAAKYLPSVRADLECPILNDLWCYYVIGQAQDLIEMSLYAVIYQQGPQNVDCKAGEGGKSRRGLPMKLGALQRVAVKATNEWVCRADCCMLLPVGAQGSLLHLLVEGYNCWVGLECPLADAAGDLKSIQGLDSGQSHIGHTCLKSAVQGHHSSVQRAPLAFVHRHGPSQLQGNLQRTQHCLGTCEIHSTHKSGVTY